MSKTNKLVIKILLALFFGAISGLYLSQVIQDRELLQIVLTVAFFNYLGGLIVAEIR